MVLVQTFSGPILLVPRILPDLLHSCFVTISNCLLRRARRLILELVATLGYGCSTELQLVYSSVLMPHGTGQSV